MKDSASMILVSAALNEFNVDGNFDVSNVDLSSLTEAVKEEYECGAVESMVEIIANLHDSIGLAEFGVIEL